MGRQRDNSLEDRIFSFIVRFKEQNDGISPSFREIQEYFDISLQTVHDRLKYLEEEGRIERWGENDKRVRGLIVPGGQWTYAGD